MVNFRPYINVLGSDGSCAFVTVLSAAAETGNEYRQLHQYLHNTKQVGIIDFGHTSRKGFSNGHGLLLFVQQDRLVGMVCLRVSISRVAELIDQSESPHNVSSAHQQQHQFTPNIPVHSSPSLNPNMLHAYNKLNQHLPRTMKQVQNLQEAAEGEFTADNINPRLHQQYTKYTEMGAISNTTSKHELHSKSHALGISGYNTRRSPAANYTNHDLLRSNARAAQVQSSTNRQMGLLGSPSSGGSNNYDSSRLNNMYNVQHSPSHRYQELSKVRDDTRDYEQSSYNNHSLPQYDILDTPPSLQNNTSQAVQPNTSKIAFKKRPPISIPDQSHMMDNYIPDNSDVGLGLTGTKEDFADDETSMLNDFLMRMS